MTRPAVGDALGGPVEFPAYDEVRSLLPNCRDWPAAKKLTTEIAKLAETVPRLCYDKLRPEFEPYGQWSEKALSEHPVDSFGRCLLRGHRPRHTTRCSANHRQQHRGASPRQANSMDGARRAVQGRFRQ
jgi:hypothetical protein